MTRNEPTISEPTISLAPRGPGARLPRAGLALLLGVVAATAALPAVARAEGQGRLDAANRAFRAERYDEAERELEQLVRDEGFAPGVLLNLGNTHLEQGALGRAILAYERARLLAPLDAAVEQNLHLARARAEVEAPPVSRAEQLASMLPARRWLGVGGAALLVFVLACVGAGVLRRGRWAAAGVGLASGAVVAACAAALWMGTFGVDRAVVVDGAATARVSPFAEAEPVFDASEGETLDAVEVHGDFVRVERPDGTGGWVPAEAIETIVPGALRASS